MGLASKPGILLTPILRKVSSWFTQGMVTPNAILYFFRSYLCEGKRVVTISRRTCGHVSCGVPLSLPCRFEYASCFSPKAYLILDGWRILLDSTVVYVLLFDLFIVMKPKKDQIFLLCRKRFFSFHIPIFEGPVVLLSELRAT